MIIFLSILMEKLKLQILEFLKNYLESHHWNNPKIGKALSNILVPKNFKYTSKSYGVKFKMIIKTKLVIYFKNNQISPICFCKIYLKYLPTYHQIRVKTNLVTLILLYINTWTWLLNNYFYIEWSFILFLSWYFDPVWNIKILNKLFKTVYKFLKIRTYFKYLSDIK